MAEGPGERPGDGDGASTVVNETTWAGRRQVRRRLWIDETPAGRLGVLQIGFRHLAIASAGSIAGRRSFRIRAERLLRYRLADAAQR